MNCKDFQMKLGTAATGVTPRTRHPSERFPIDKLEILDASSTMEDMQCEWILDHTRQREEHAE